MRVLVIKPSSLGDIIHTLPAVRAIKKNFPHTRISWVISDSFFRFAELFDDVDEIIIFKRRDWSKIHKSFELLQFFYGLRRRYFDIVLDFQGLLRSGIITFFAKSPVKVGFSEAREGASFFYSKKVTIPNTVRHAVEKNIYLVNQAFNISEGYLTPRIQTTPDAITEAQSLLRRFDLDACNHLIALAPAARWESKTWPSFFFPK